MAKVLEKMCALGGRLAKSSHLMQFCLLLLEIPGSNAVETEANVGSMSDVSFVG